MSRGNGRYGESTPFTSDALDRVSDPSDYAALRRVRNLEDARQNVLDTRERAYELFWGGRIDRDDYLKALRMAVERYLSESRQTIRRHRFAQWFWKGEPPTVDGRSPFRVDEGGEPELYAVLPSEEIEHPEADDPLAAIELADQLPAGKRLKKPILVVDDDGRPPFGREPNTLGRLTIPKPERRPRGEMEMGITAKRRAGKDVGDDGPRVIEFRGLRSVVEFPDPLRVQRDEMADHPIAIKTPERTTSTYQLPEGVSMAAFDLLNRFWESEAGLGLKGGGLPKQTGINFADGERGHVERGDI